MEIKTLILPNPDWIITKEPRYNGKDEYWYIIRHKHSGSKPSPIFHSSYNGVRTQYRCAKCSVPVPEEVSGFRNLIQWSEV